MKIDLNLIQQVTLALVIIFSLALGFGVFIANKKSQKNLFYLSIALTMIIWNISSFLVYYQPAFDYSLLFARINFFAVALFFVSVYLFVYHFPQNRNKYALKDTFFAVFGVLLAVLSITTPWIIKSISINGTDIIWHMGGIIVWIYYSYAVATTLIVFYRLIRNYRCADLNDKKRLLSFFVGIGFVATFNIVFNIIWASIRPTDNIYWLGDYSVIFLLGFTAYAITKHQMFNIKLIATETIVYVLSILLLAESFTLNTNNTEFAIKLIVWLIVTYAGRQLIFGVKKEIEQREKLARLTNDLEKANEHLKEVDKLKDDFLSMASHELNTPIAAIEGYLSMILIEKMAGEIPAKAKQYLDSVFKSAQRLAGMVKDLLNVSRIESGRIHIIYEDKPIEEVIDQSIMEVMSKAREAHHKLTFERSKKPMPKTWYDTTRITEILINIMGNAIKYTDPGGKITLRTTSDDRKIIVACEDNGKGIPKERQKAVFEKFTQVDVLKDEVKGTGLGMYIAKKFIELHKGQIWFHSDGAGKGTTFYFSLPILAKKPFDAHEGEGSVLH